MEEGSEPGMEAIASRILRLGVFASAALVLIGLALTAVTGDTSNPYGLLDLDWIVWGDPFLEPSHIIYLGFMILILTPVLNIVALISVFIKARDGAFATIASLVLLILILGFTLGVG
ncbi:DUF1634 domain-containing protein [Candidatus Bathyarchaeota archaeon]|nr:MAG: DUF1634 domain-containing protein [Candidatus Bathyarchaeota archaeon]